jgi:hypothetical protein
MNESAPPAIHAMSHRITKAEGIVPNSTSRLLNSGEPGRLMSPIKRSTIWQNNVTIVTGISAIARLNQIGTRPARSTGYMNMRATMHVNTHVSSDIVSHDNMKDAVPGHFSDEIYPMMLLFELYGMHLPRNFEKRFFL